jgi:hypothetical protein
LELDIQAGVMTNFVVTPLRRSSPERLTLSNAAPLLALILGTVGGCTCQANSDTNVAGDVPMYVVGDVRWNRPGFQYIYAGNLYDLRQFILLQTIHINSGYTYDIRLFILHQTIHMN